MWLTPFHRVEWAHAVAQNVFRRALSNQNATQLHSDFEADVRRGVWLEVAIPEATFETAIELARKHVPKLGCRTLDTLHVASALELGADEFWSFDSRQLKLARAAGLKAS
jgi:predicted nucleic acid-binding protein